VSAPVISHGNAPPVLEFGEHIFDLMALPVKDGVIGNEGLPVFLWRDAGSDTFAD